MLPVLLLVLAGQVAGAAAEPRSWTPRPRSLPASLAGAGPQTYEVFCHGDYSDPIDAGLRWTAPQKLAEFTIEYGTLGGRSYEPAVSGQTLEYWSGGAWHAIPAQIEIDYRRMGEFAPVQGSGTARWTYRFAPVETTQLRVLWTQPRNEETWRRCYSVRRMRATPAAQPFSRPEVRIQGSLPEMPEWLAPGANLAVPEAGAEIAGTGMVEVRWQRRLLLNRVETVPPVGGLAVTWWDGTGWRDVESLPPPTPGTGRFLPVSTERIRVRSATGPIRKVRAFLDSDADRYFREIERGRTDLLGRRFRLQPAPGLAGMQSLLLPLNYAKAAIGRPADQVETMVTWNGAFLLTDPGPHGDTKASADRWFTFASGPGKKPFASQWARIRGSYLEGCLPATVMQFTENGLHYEETIWVTEPGAGLYGTVAELRITNQSASTASVVATLAMGRRPHSPGGNATPLAFGPLPTGYSLDADRRTVRAANGDVVLYAGQEGAWEGTPRENHLRHSFSLAPRQSRTLRFFAPSVEAPIQDPGAVRRFDWAAARQAFRSWWRDKLTAGTRIELPEPALNDIYKNLIAQALIITVDGDSLVRYGAYSYESYFGLEEGWPAVALAQFGYPAEAQQILSIMLRPELMDKKNYHHQYRNGLEAWYAATIYRLTGDRRWLEKIAPDLEAAAEWTIRTINANKDPKYGGILPRHAYGGDIHTPAYSFYSNATCWRGLKDTALVFRALGRFTQAQRYDQAADAYRSRLWELADRLAGRESNPVFLPMSFEVGSGAEYREKEPAYAFLSPNVPASNTWVYLGNYWNLFAPCFLELKLFENSDRRSAWVADYMDARGGVLAGLVRFTLGLDQIYGKGYYENLLERGKRDEFITSLYGIFAHGMSQDLYSFPEVAGVFPLRTSNAAMWAEHQRNIWDWGFQGWLNSEGEPLSAGPGMALQLLRMALVRETVESSPQDTLRLLDGAPRHWFEAGKRIAVRNAATFFGKVSFDTEARKDSVTARVTRSPGFSAREVVLRLPHPQGRPLRRVTANGQAWTDFRGEEIRLPAGEQVTVVADY